MKSGRVLLHIDSLGAGGDAVARHQGRVFFVPGAAPGERVEAEILEERDRSSRARLLRVLEPAASRVEPGCPHFSICGGCQWLHVSRAEQEAAKEALFWEALARIGGVERASLDSRPLVPSVSAFGYRQRATLHMAGGRLGFRARESHQTVSVQACRLLDRRLEQAATRLNQLFSEIGPVPRCQDVSLACDGERVTAAFAVARSSPAALERVERAVARVPLDGALLVPRPGLGQVPAQGACGDFGETLLSFPAPCAPGVTLHGRADLFAQANATTNELLVREVLRQLDSKRNPSGAVPERILELFAGTGNFTFAMAARGASVTAVEASTAALELARMSARQAGISSVRFIAGDASRTAGSLARGGERYDALVLDPPRTGMKGVGLIAAQLGVGRVIYISCDPATLARDVGELGASGFRLVSAVPVDMFPQTFHVEAVVRMERI